MADDNEVCSDLTAAVGVFIVLEKLYDIFCREFIETVFTMILRLTQVSRGGGVPHPCTSTNYGLSSGLGLTSVRTNTQKTAKNAERRRNTSKDGKRR